MKILILLAFFSSQIYSHILFVNDSNYPPGGNTVSTSGSNSNEMISAVNNSGITSELTFAGFKNTGNNETALEQTSPAIPGGYYLGQKSPSPFDPETNIYFSLPVRQHVRIVILDMLGQPVKVLVSNEINAGTYKMNIDGSGLSSGVYVFRFETENFYDSRKLLLIK